MKILQFIFFIVVISLLQNCDKPNNNKKHLRDLSSDKSRCIHITDVSRPQVFYLKMKNGHPNSLILTITSDIDYNPEFRFSSRMYNRTLKNLAKDTTNKKEAIEYFHNVIEIPIKAKEKNLRYDWYSDTLTLYYFPKKAKKGEILIKWK